MSRIDKKLEVAVAGQRDSTNKAFVAAPLRQHASALPPSNIDN